MIRTCAVIPYYDHPETLPSTVDTLRRCGLTCWIVDDGSGPGARAVARQLVEQQPDLLRLITHEMNRGKGAAVLSGCRAAAEAGYTHVLQVDADGQHDLGDVPEMLAQAANRPDALVLGAPRFDTSVPRSRLYGRFINHLWVWINTLSFEIRDSMCGFRVYPLVPLLRLSRAQRLGERMDFDTEVLVRLHWCGTPIVHIPTRVTYPPHGVSHYDVWGDNLLIVSMHARLFLGMLWRLPRLVASRMKQVVR